MPDGDERGPTPPRTDDPRVEPSPVSAHPAAPMRPRGGGARDDRRSGPGNLPRLFVAVPVPEDVASAVGAVIDSTRAALGDDARAIRWVQMAGLHLTIRFLGPTPPDRIPEIRAAVDAVTADHARFAVRLAGAGAFPEAGRPRALWIGISEGVDGLAAIAGDLETRLAAAGWQMERRPYRPHVTVARTDGIRVGPVAATILAEVASVLDVGFEADRIVLYRSHLGSGPGRYEPLHSAALD
ncbi:MAG: RNA 2',3'-cyclic phosphodiesterase [Candidatus Limnocylindrales bacterium]